MKQRHTAVRLWRAKVGEESPVSSQATGQVSRAGVYFAPTTALEASCHGCYPWVMPLASVSDWNLVLPLEVTVQILSPVRHIRLVDPMSVILMYNLKAGVTR